MIKLLKIIEFFLFAWLVMLALEWFGQERYPQDGTPNRLFTVLSRDENNQPAAVFWQDIQTDTVFITQATEYGQTGERFFRLRPLGADTYELYADMDANIITTRYRIRHGQVEPLSFRMRNIGMMFWGLLSAYPLLKLFNILCCYLLRRYLRRKAA